MVIVTIGFVYELGKGALKIDSKQNISLLKPNSSNTSIPNNNFNYYLAGLIGHILCKQEPVGPDTEGASTVTIHKLAYLNHTQASTATSSSVVSTA